MTIEAKAVLVEKYAREAGLRSLVVGVSGGVDSAVTLALCLRAARRRGSTLERVVAALLPLTVDAGATNQSTALARGREVCAALRGRDDVLRVVEADLGAAHAATRGAVEKGLGIAGDAWAAGQLVSTMRTPALYYVTSLLTSSGLPAALVGTTNRDEGAYLGFFGKASDGMVDLQLVGDLHKSEVYACARALGVPHSVVDAAPTGDTYDGKTDREMIGASYDDVELYLSLRERGAHHDAGALRALGELLEARHAANAHKYVGDSPAIFLDVWPRAIPGGWRAPPRGEAHAVDAARFVAPFDLDVALDVTLDAALDAELDAELDANPGANTAANPGARTPARFAESVGDAGDAVVRVRGLLSKRERVALAGAFAKADKVPVGIDGRPNADLSAVTTTTGAVGSLRASAYAPALAASLWERLAPMLPPVRIVDELTSTDHDDHPVWRAVGINPLFRFMQSAPGGFLVPHTDSTYDFGDGRRTLTSVLVALDDGGATHILVDPQRNIPMRERVFADDAAPARDSRVLTRVVHEAGDALLLDHRVPHEGARDDGTKLLVRTDIVYERCAASAFAAREKTIATTATATATAAKWDRDPFYTGLDAKAADAAGWFDDGAASPDVVRERDARWLVTPLHKLRVSQASALDDESLADKRPLVAIVTTGALCPVHRGHVELMERAKEALTAEGFHVVGGWLAPDHDRYVTMKTGAGAVAAGERIRLCEEAVADSDWLMVDPWAALHIDRAVNFTDVILRLEGLLAHHVRSTRPIRVAYAFGSDNARFAGAFRNRGLGVCVTRPGAPGPASTSSSTEGVRVIFARSPSVIASSSAVRDGAHDALPERVRDAWRARGAPPKRARVTVRDEGEWAVSSWADAAAGAYARFRDGVVGALRGAFGGAVDVDVCALAAQRARLSDELGAHRSLSLDPCIAGDANLAVSRCFDVGARDSRPGLVARPGHPPLASQLGALPAGDFVLVDDDSVSGTTLAAVRAMLPRDIRITREIALCDLRPRDHDGGRGGAVVDLVDCRDFLAGAREAGLVLALPSGALVRAPYVWPYARPAERSSIPSSAEASFSRAIWQLNARFFDEVRVRVRDTWPAFRALCHELDFAADDDMREVCAFHLDRIA